MKETSADVTSVRGWRDKFTRLCERERGALGKHMRRLSFEDAQVRKSHACIAQAPEMLQTVVQEAFRAMIEAAGLKLETRKVRKETIVIDQLEKMPTAN